MSKAPKRAGIDWTSDNDPLDLSHLAPNVEPHPAFTPYVLESEHERVKAQRDRLLEAAKAGWPWLSHDTPDSIRDAMVNAISACEETPDAREGDGG